MKLSIKHIWFDFSDTIAVIKKERHDALKYECYAEVVNNKVDQDLKDEYNDLLAKFNQSNSALFYSFGLPADYWAKKVGAINPAELFELADKDIPQVFNELKERLPISIFSNIDLHKILSSLGWFDLNIFQNILSGGMVGKPKPALDGYYKMVELSQLLTDEILYIGDSVGKDILPAKQVGIRTGLMWKRSAEADFCFNKFADILDII